VITKILMLLGATLGGAAGWWAGARFGVMTAFIVSTILSGFGMYYARKWALNYWS
jgi:hypothetical protein